jgi:hypothetical protein
MNPTETSPCRSEVDRVFVAAVKQIFDECMTLQDLDRIALHLKKDRIATNEEKRLLRADYALVRKFLTRDEEYAINDESGRILRKHRGRSKQVEKRTDAGGPVADVLGLRGETRPDHPRDGEAVAGPEQVG